MDVEKLRYRAKSYSTFVVPVEKLASNKELSSFGLNLVKQLSKMMKKVYGDYCLSRSRIHEWFKRFQEGREALEIDIHFAYLKFTF